MSFAVGPRAGPVTQERCLSPDDIFSRVSLWKRANH